MLGRATDLESFVRTYPVTMGLLYVLLNRARALPRCPLSRFREGVASMSWLVPWVSRARRGLWVRWLDREIIGIVVAGVFVYVVDLDRLSALVAHTTRSV